MTDFNRGVNMVSEGGAMDSRSIHTGKIMVKEDFSIPQELDLQANILMELNKMIGMLEDYLEPLMGSKPPTDGSSEEKDTVGGKSPILVQIQANNSGLRNCAQAIHQITQRVQL